MNKESKYIVVYIVVFLLAVIMLAGCAANKPQIPSPPAPVEPQTNIQTPTPEVVEEKIEEYIPLKLGNKWEYEGEGDEFASFTQEVTHQKGNRYQIKTVKSGIAMTDVYELREDSIVDVYRSGKMFNNENLLSHADNMEIVLIKLPVAVGTRWVSEENIYEIIQTDARVTVPYGTFDNCVVVRLTFKDGSTMLMYYKKGIGMVLSDFRTDGESIISRLTSFTSK